MKGFFGTSMNRKRTNATGNENEKKTKHKKTSFIPITAFFDRQPNRSINSTVNIPTNDSNDRDAINEINDSCESDKENHHNTLSSGNRDDKLQKEKEEEKEEIEGFSDEEDAQINSRRGEKSHQAKLKCALFHMLRQRQMIGKLPRQTEQQLIRWAVSRLRISPISMSLKEEHFRHMLSYRMSYSDTKAYTSCLQFDSQGALLVSGSSNGVIALYDFDEYFHKSINITHEYDASKAIDKYVEPIHTIFTAQEIKRIRWNPRNEDEIACCFSSRNEIHLYNLQKFPTRPYRILKGNSRPSSGYCDVVFLASSGRVQVIAGDIDGAVRAWDVRFPQKPLWIVSSGNQPINSLALTHDQRYLLIGTEAGLLMTYDVQRLVTPAFGTKPMPQRVASFRINDTIQKYVAQRYQNDGYDPEDHPRYRGIVSLKIPPESSHQVICQLRNDWIVAVDFLRSKALKLHTFLKRNTPPRPVQEIEEEPRISNTVLNDPRVLVMNPALQRAPLQGTDRNSWLNNHRCEGTLLFNGAILCTGVHEDTNLTLIDLNQPVFTSTWYLDSHIQRLHRLRLPIETLVTAVSSHPTRHLLVCGMEDMKLMVLSPSGNVISSSDEV